MHTHLLMLQSSCELILRLILALLLDDLRIGCASVLEHLLLLLLLLVCLTPLSLLPTLSGTQTTLIFRFLNNTFIGPDLI